MTPPQWAVALVQQVYCAEHRGDIPTLYWRHGNGSGSSGYALLGQNSITICAGRDPVDLKHVILHECAHQLTKQGHTAQFWDVAFLLFRRYGLPMARMRERSGNYRKRAIAAYDRHCARFGDIPMDAAAERDAQDNPLLPAQPDWDLLLGGLNSERHLNSGPLFPEGQMPYLSERAGKLYLYLLGQRKSLVSTSYPALTAETGIKHTNLAAALKDLERHALIERQDERAGGQVSGLAIQVLRPPDVLPARVREERREQLLRLREKHRAELKQIDEELETLATV